MVAMMIASFPAWAAVSSTNGRIAFTRRDPMGNGLIYTANPDGSDERLLFPLAGEQPRWSPDGNEVDVRTDDGLAATIVNADTGSFRALPVPDPVFTCTPTTTPEQCANTDFSCQFAWSPDGTRLACGAISGVDPSRNGIYTVRSSDGGDLTLVKACPPACGYPGDFSPDGKRLVFLGSDQNDQLRIYTIKLNGAGLKPLTPAGMDLNDEDLGKWSPQGGQILFAARPAPGHRFALWMVRTDGTGLHQVPIPSCGGALADPTSVGCPQAGWSPDGTKIVFSRVSSKGRQENIYTVNADGSGLLQVTQSGYLDLFPDWGTHPAG
jgi:Tol biopolymer transport system component